MKFLAIWFQCREKMALAMQRRMRHKETLLQLPEKNSRKWTSSSQNRQPKAPPRNSLQRTRYRTVPYFSAHVLLSSLYALITFEIQILYN